MNLDIIWKYKMFYVVGVKNTILLAVFSVIFGLILGISLSLMKISRSKVLNGIASSYIGFFRGTPLIVQVYIIFYGLPFDLEKFTAGILALSLNSGAYVAEIFRSGIQSIDKGQMEAARSLGMSYRMAMRYIIIPQAIKNVLPALGNEFIVVLKESAIVSVIGIHELMYNANTVKGNTYEPFIPLFAAAIIYLILTASLSRLIAALERRLRAGDQSI